jgi:hypothetical protein
MAIERNNSFHLLLSDDELQLLKLLAEKEGLNASDYLRMLIRNVPNASTHVAQGMRLAAAIGTKVDLAQLFEAYTDSLKAAAPGASKKKAK